MSPDDPTLTAYVLNELPPDEAAEVAARVAASSELQAAVAELEQVCAALRAGLGGGAAAPLGAEQREAITRAARRAAASSLSFFPTDFPTEPAFMSPSDPTSSHDSTARFADASPSRHSAAQRGGPGPAQPAWRKVLTGALAASLAAGLIALLVYDPGPRRAEVANQRDAFRETLGTLYSLEDAARQTQGDTWRATDGVDSRWKDLSDRRRRIVSQRHSLSDAERAPGASRAGDDLETAMEPGVDAYERDERYEREGVGRLARDLRGEPPERFSELGLSGRGAARNGVYEFDSKVAEEAKELDLPLGESRRALSERTTEERLEAADMPRLERRVELSLAELDGAGELAPAHPEPKPVPTGEEASEAFKGDNGRDLAGDDGPVSNTARERPSPLPTETSPTSDWGVKKPTSDETPLAKTRAAPPKKTWRPAKATPNAARLLVGEQDELLLEGLQIHAKVDGFRARVLVDYYFYNDRDRPLEGSFQLRLPGEASVYYFAFGETTVDYRPKVDKLAGAVFLNDDAPRGSGTGSKDVLLAREGTWEKVKEARFVPPEKAAHAYGETTRRRVDPALVEWSGAGVFQSKVFPLAPHKLHRIVVGYDHDARVVGDELVYRLELPENREQCQVELDVAALPSFEKARIEPPAAPLAALGRSRYQFDNPSGPAITLTAPRPDRLLLRGADAETGSFFAARFTPDLPGDAAPGGDPSASAEGAGAEATPPAPEATRAGASRALFLVDTSLSAQPEKFNTHLALLEGLLTQNRATLREFAVLFFNVETHWWKAGYTANTPEQVAELLAYCDSLALEGATDLRAALAEAAAPAWRVADDSAEAKGAELPDLFLLSDGAMTWGEVYLAQLARVLRQGRVGALFAYNTGLAGTAIGVLDGLARETGGAVFSVASEEELARAVVAHRQRPWRLLDLQAPGGSDVLVAGRPQTIYPGQPLLITGRGALAGPVRLRARRGDETREFTVEFPLTLESELAPRLYGQTAVGQLEEVVGGAAEDVTVAYARHFRVTCRSCSLLMLETEQDYERFQIKPENDAFVVKTAAASTLLDKQARETEARLASPKAAFVAWLAKLEKFPHAKVEVPTALRLTIDNLPEQAFEVGAPAWQCNSRMKADVPADFAARAKTGEWVYDAVLAEALRRKQAHGAADALKALSTLVEVEPGDPVVARDVAFSALEWGLGAQAYPLLARVARQRPFEPQVYQALAQCLVELGKVDLAMLYYEVALAGQWPERYQDFGAVARVEYLHLLRRVAGGEFVSAAPGYVAARLDGLAKENGLTQADLIITLMWNTDRTDVDLHVIEPSGEDCHYGLRETKSGGRLTRDVTEGFGPEMYVAPKRQQGVYRVEAKYFRGDDTRTKLRTKAYLTVYQGWGAPECQVLRRTITLDKADEQRELLRLGE